MEQLTVKLPRNIEVEAGLIGAILIENSLIDEIAVDLKQEHFHEPLHGRIYEAVRKLIHDGKFVSPVILKPLFETDPAMIELGGVGYLLRLTADGAGLIGARDMAQQIYDLALLREIILTGQDLITEALDTSEEIDPVRRIEAAQDRLSLITSGETARHTFDIKGATRDTIAELQAEARGEGEPSMRPKGCAAWNRAVDGMVIGDLTILAGRPGMMKTGMGLRIAKCAAMDGIATDFVSMEMKRKELVIRLLCDEAFTAESSPKHDHVKNWNLSEGERGKIERAQERIDQSQFRLHVTPELSLARLTGLIRASKRRWKREGRDLRLVVIDYLQLMSGKAENRQQEISGISRGLKILAGSLDIHIIALSQLNRSVEARDNKRPMLSDLRESGSLEQDASNVVFLYRDAYYLAQQEPKGHQKDPLAYDKWRKDMHDVEHELELIAAKVRSSATTIQRAYVNLPHQAIRDLDWAERDNML